MRRTKTIKVPTTGTFDFETLITSDSGKYVDKTALLYELARHKADAQLFISRPRRFGKSLMLSTLKAMFEGRRDLFKGLAIDKLPWEGWKTPTPVYSFTMTKAVGGTYGKFQSALALLVSSLCEEAGIEYNETVDASVNFDRFLVAAAKKSPTKKIVVLVDEYDEPVAKFLDDVKTLNKVRSDLHDFYEKLKANSATIRFLLMTGVTKLTKLSVFSGLNHLKDRSMDARFATLLGYTPKELDGPLRENVEMLGAKNGMGFAEAKRSILSWYDGYRFSPDSKDRVCNPVSLGSALEDGKLKGYWESTGQASLIIDRIKKAGKMPENLENVPADAMTLDVCDAETLPMESLLYQGGYLTIKDVIPPPRDSDGPRGTEARLPLAGDGVEGGYLQHARRCGEAADCFRRLERLRLRISLQALCLDPAGLADQGRGGGEALLPAFRVHDGGQSAAGGRVHVRLRRRRDRDAVRSLRVRVQVPQEREGSDTADSRA